MIYHFAAPEHTLEDIAKSREKLFTTIPFAEGKGLSEMIADNLKNMSNVEAVIIDCWQLPDTKQALQMLMEIGFDARILLLINDAETEETIQLREGYTILNQAHRDITEELALFISGEQLIEEKKSIWIGIASAEGGAGATTLAMQLTMLLASAEQTCYIEADGSGQLEEVAKWYDMQPIDGGYQYREAFFAVNAMNEDMFYNIIDFGQLSGRKIKMLNQCQVKILAADAKPYGIKNLVNILRLKEEIEGRLDICLNFAGDDKKEQEKILDNLSELDGDYRLHINSLNPHFFSVSENLPVLKRLICGIADIPEPQKKAVCRLPAELIEIGEIGLRKIEGCKKQLAAAGAACITLALLATGVHGMAGAGAEDSASFSIKPPSVGLAGFIEPGNTQAEQPDDTVQPEGQITEAPPAETVTEIPTEQPSEVPEDTQAEQADTSPTAEQPVTEAVTEAPVSEEPDTEASESTEAATKSPKKKKKKKKKTTTEEADQTPPATEETAPDISKYDKDILSGSQVKKLIKTYGSYYSIIVETRNNGTGSYGLAGNSSQDIIDSKVSFYATLMYSGSEVSGLYLLQQ